MWQFKGDFVIISKGDYMGDYKKHLNLVKEKLESINEAFKEKRYTVVGDLGTKVVEQLVEADAAKISQHFGDHRARHEYANANYPDEITHAMRRIWFAYGDLGYDGVNGGRAREAMENLEIVIRFFKERFGEKIG